MAETSAAKIEANRKNAFKSTGPKTPAGKQKSKHNALKYGILSKELIIQAGDGKENETEFTSLMDRLWDDLQPRGALEEMSVERIAMCYWRLRRAARAEVGEIRQELDTLTWDATMQEINQFHHEKRWASILDESREKLRQSCVGAEYLIGVLEQVKEQVERDGYVSDDSLATLMSHFGKENDSLTYWCGLFSKMATEGHERVADDSEKRGGTLPPEQCKAAILSFLDTEKQRLVKGKEIFDENTNLHMESKALSLEVPAAADKILRYETTIERQMYRAIGELERVQDRRKDEILNCLVLMMQTQYCETKPPNS